MLIFGKNDGSSSFSQISSNEIAYDQVRILRESESFSDPVLDFLWSAGLDDSHLEMLHELATIARNLSAGSMRIVSTDDERSASLPAQAELVSIIDDADRVRSDVEPDALHDSNGLTADIQCAVEH